MADDGAELPKAITSQIRWLPCVGLDKSETQRGIGTLHRGELKAHHFGIKGLTVLAPITPKIGA
jgi:hypothetical protein